MSDKLKRIIIEMNSKTQELNNMNLKYYRDTEKIYNEIADLYEAAHKEGKIAGSDPEFIDSMKSMAQNSRKTAEENRISAELSSTLVYQTAQHITVSKNN